MLWTEADNLAKAYGDSFFVFDEDEFRRSLRSLHRAFASIYPNTRIGYSYKTNYTPAVCQVAHDCGALAEIVSDMEHWLAKRLGVLSHEIIYNGPCKAETSVRDVLCGGGIVNLDNSRDLELVVRIASDCAAAPGRVGLRCNFPLQEGSRSRFGIDVIGDDFADAVTTVRRTAGLQLQGLHCHLPDRNLASFTRRAESMIAVAQRVFAESPPVFVNFGGGFMGSMSESFAKSLGVQHVSFDEYAVEIAGRMRGAYGIGADSPDLIIEPGTAVVASCFKFYTRVAHVKQIGVRRVATVAGSLLNFSASARRRDLPCSVLSPQAKVDDAGDALPCDVGGFTCIESDLLATGLRGKLEVGDFLVFENVGSYSVVMKPPFILPAPAVLRQRQVEGATPAYDVIRTPETHEHVFEGFAFPGRTANRAP
jgi:diaminopimelate decarboxylase